MSNNTQMQYKVLMSYRPLGSATDSNPIHVDLTQAITDNRLHFFFDLDQNSPPQIKDVKETILPILQMIESEDDEW